MKGKPYFNVSVIYGEKKRVTTGAEGENILKPGQNSEIHIDASAEEKGNPAGEEMARKGSFGL